MSRLALLGGGGHASDVLSVIEAQPERLVKAVVSDDAWTGRQRFEGRNVEMVDGLLTPLVAGTHYVIAIGYPKPRKRIAELASQSSADASGPLLHPMASIGFGADLAEGTVVFGQTWLSPLVRVGQHTHILYGSTIGHDTSIGAFTSVMPGCRLAGEVTVGESVLLGTGAVVLEGRTVGDRSVVGAGAVVTRDVPPGSTVLGIPAKEAS